MNGRLACGLLTLSLVGIGARAEPPWTQAGGPAAPVSATTLIHQASDAVYNLDYGDAIAIATRAVALEPDSSATHRMHAWVLWNQMLFQHGAASVDYYVGSVNKSQATLPRPSPELEAEFHRELDRAVALAEAHATRNPHDADAQHDLGTAYALQASFAASIESKVATAFGAARHAYEADDRAMSLAPDRAEAGLVVGTYRYIVAGFSLPVRFVAYFAGLGGGKEEGISLVEAAARHGNAQDDAKFALLLIYTRELRHNEALAVVRELEARFPRNRILVFEEGSCALRAGRAAEAEAILTAGIDRLDRDPRPRVPGERAQWFYKRGAARLAANHRPGAAADLNAALAADPVGWVRGRIHLELAKLADLDTDRTRALAEYKQAETICVQNNDPVCSGDAERFEHRPFTLRSAQ